MIDTSAEERWAAAAQLAAGVDDENLPYRRRKLVRMAAVLVGSSLLLGIVIATLLAISIVRNGPPSPSESDNEEWWRIVVAGVLALIGVVIFVVGFIWGKRTGHFLPRWRSVASPLNRAEFASVRRQIAGKADADQDHLDTVIAIARQDRKVTWGIVPLFTGVAFFIIANMIVASNVLHTLLHSVSLVGILVIAVALRMAYRRAGRFLDTHTRPA